MITGRQIREARALLKWGQWRLAQASQIATSTIIRAESVDDEAPITAAQARQLMKVLGGAGVEFVPENGGGVGVRLRKQIRRRVVTLGRH